MNFQGKKPNKYKIQYSQNFISTSKLSNEVVELSDVNPHDLIIEIGAGKGALTDIIAKKAKAVFAIEKDTNLYENLIKTFKDNDNVTIINKDFLNYALPSSDKYKVIGNIPFGLTSNIIKKLLDSSNPPTNTYLILQKEAAIRFLGSDYINNRENLFSLRYKPFFKGEIIKIFNRYDFSPRPNVDIVMLRIEKLENAMVSDKNMFLDFVSFCLTSWKPNLIEILKLLFTSKQLNFIKSNLKNKILLKPSEIKFKDWLYLFEIYFNHCEASKKEMIRGSFRKLEESQSKLIKDNRTRLVYKRKLNE